MARFLVQNFVKHTPNRVCRVLSFPVLNISVGRRLSLCTKISLDEITDDILNQILAAGEDPSVYREEICVSYIQKLCAAGNLAAAAKLPQTLRGKLISLSSHTYNHLLEAASRNNDIQLLSQIFKDLLVSCGSIRLDSYLILARAYGKLNDPAMLFNFIREVSEMGLPRKDIVLNRFIFALAKCGCVDKALMVFHHMKGFNSKPDLVTYNTVLAILGRLGRVNEMLKEFAYMHMVDLYLDIFTHNTVLNSLRKMGRLDLCFAHFKEMCERGIEPDLMSFKALIESLGRSGNIEAALQVFDEMRFTGIYPSVHIYRALIFSLKRMEKMELALKFSSEMNKLVPLSVVPRDFQYKSR